MSTHTFAELKISEGAWDEIAHKLRKVGYHQVFIGDAIDMHGIGLTKGQPVPKGQISDGYHTFDELYEHRYLLFLALQAFLGRLTHWNPNYVWKSKKHWESVEAEEAVPVWDGWFLAGAKIGESYITYHIPMKYWDLGAVHSVAIPPKWDGHTSEDVIQRLTTWLTR